MLIMKAKLVYATFITRVVVDDNATEDQIIESAIPGIVEKAKNELYDSITEIEDDIEMPV